MINKTYSIKDLLQINLPNFTDDRGFFREVIRVETIEANIKIKFEVKQMNHSRSVKNTLRGIHIAPWNKLIYVARGTVQAVIVDARQNSKTYGKYQSFEIGEKNKTALFIPAGCGNSYLVLSGDADYIYLTDEKWSPNKEIGILWNDPKLNISWQLKETPVLSNKDKNNLLLKDVMALA